MAYSCNDNIVLFIGNPREGDLAENTSIFVLESIPGRVCAYGEIWFLDLLNEFFLRGYWIPTAGTSRVAQENVTERIPIGIIGTGEYITNELVKLDLYIQEANKWHRGQKRNNSMWLYNQFNGETNLRRSLIYSIEPNEDIRQYSTPNSEKAVDMNLNIQRHFCWENYEITFRQQFDTEPYWGFIQDLGVDKGTVNNRIQLFNLYDLVRNPATLRILGQVWTGIKEDIGCGLDVWSPLWECETGVDRSGYANINVPDLTASAGFYRTVNFPAVGTPLTTQITMTLINAFPTLTLFDYEQFRGDYIVLLRAKLSNSLMSVPMTIRYGWKDGGRKNIVRQSPVVFTGEADWRLIEMGVISLPPDSGRQALSVNDVFRNNLSEYSIDILAGLDASGALGNLQLDALYLIPYEHHAILRYQGAFSPAFAADPVDTDALILATHENDTSEARYINPGIFPALSTDPVADYIVTTNDYFLPYKGSRVVYAANAFDEVGGIYKNVNELDFDMLSFYRIYPRWLSYRND